MLQTQMNIEVRTDFGKNANRKLRAAGQIPGVVYGRGMEPVAVSFAPKALSTAIAGEGGLNNLITLQGGGALDKMVVIVADIQRTALKGNALHVDLHKVNMEEKVKINVPVKLVGTAVGVKDGGLMDFSHHTLHVECLPGQIPEHIEIDITDIKVGHSIHISEISFPAGVKCLDNPKAAIVGVLGKAKEDAPAEA
jgi:large subunit ribosomal protein L25